MNDEMTKSATADAISKEATTFVPQLHSASNVTPTRRHGLSCNLHENNRIGEHFPGVGEAYGMWRRYLLVLMRGIHREAGGQRPQDEGDWRYSPEWWGTQGGGWGRDCGDVVFESRSAMGNGVVAVTAHSASTPVCSIGRAKWLSSPSISSSQTSTLDWTEDFPAVGRELQQRLEREGRAGHDHGLFQILGYDWRVLRFNLVTRQSVAKVMAVRKDTNTSHVMLLQQPNCIAFEYVKSMLSVGLTTASLSGLNLQGEKIRILCVGLGGGSLPLFLAHNLVGAIVEVVEIDPAVIEAAVESMGFPPCRATVPSKGTACNSVPKSLSEVKGLSDKTGRGSRTTWQMTGEQSATVEGPSGSSKVSKTGVLKHQPFLQPNPHISGNGFGSGARHGIGKDGNDLRGCVSHRQVEPDHDEIVLWGSILRRMFVYEADGEDFVAEALLRQLGKEGYTGHYDMVFVDAYDGEDVVPFKLWNRNGPFLTALGSLLHPKHGTVVVNLHTDSPPPSLLERATGQYGPGFDPLLPQGRRVQDACVNYRDALLSSSVNQANLNHGGASRHGTVKGGSQSVTGSGVAFTVAVPLQGNLSLVVARGVSVQDVASAPSGNRETTGNQALVNALVEESKNVERTLGLSLDFSRRVVRGFQVVK